MDIVEPTSSFDFNVLTLLQPVSIHGGAYFTKLEHNRKTLYVQCPKCLTRQGFVKSGKKYYCDLMFDQTATGLIQWLEGLETRCREVLYQRRQDWFENSLEESDIENAFNSCIRVFRSGKFYLVRANVRNSASGVPSLRIYDERECILQMEDVTADKHILSILEIQGIKFTSRSFQLEIILKQVMVIDDEPVFDNCLIRTSKIALSVPAAESSNNKITFDKSSSSSGKSLLEEDMIDEEQPTENLTLEFVEADDLVPPATPAAALAEQEPEVEAIPAVLDSQDVVVQDYQEPASTQSQEPMPPLQFASPILEQEEELQPVTELVFGDDAEEAVVLRKPNEVYLQLYRDAKKKAAEAKQQAIAALLEAKNIKMTYLLDDADDSDDSDLEFALNAAEDEIAEEGEGLS